MCTFLKVLGYVKLWMGSIEVCWDFPQVAGAIDGTHIPVIRPQDNPSDYYN